MLKLEDVVNHVLCNGAHRLAVDVEDDREFVRLEPDEWDLEEVAPTTAEGSSGATQTAESEAVAEVVVTEQPASPTVRLIDFSFGSDEANKPRLETLAAVARTVGADHPYIARGLDGRLHLLVVVRTAVPRVSAEAWAERLVTQAFGEHRPEMSVSLEPGVPDRTAFRAVFRYFDGENVLALGEQFRTMPAARIDGLDALAEAHVIGGGIDGLDLTALGAKDRMREAMGETLLFVPELKVFALWDGKRWDTKSAHRVQGAYEDQLRAMTRRCNLEMLHIDPKSEHGKRLKRVSRYLEGPAKSSKAVADVFALLEREDSIQRSVSAFDADPWGLNTPSGIVDLRTGTVRPNHPGALCRHVTRAEYRANATCPLFESVVRRAMSDDEQRVRHLQLRLGSTLAGVNPEQVASFFLGAGANGKGVIANAVLRALGDYGVACSPDTFMAKRNRGDIREDLVALEGARFVLTSEANANDELDIALLKRMTGGDAISARGGYEKVRSMTPTWKIIMLTNSRPRVTDPDFAVWRRVEVVPFDVVIPEHERDPFLDAKLDNEAPGILRWLVEGCVGWYRAGCRIEKPQAVRDAAEAYSRDEDPVRTWAMDTNAVELRDDAETGATAAFEAYAVWCRAAGSEPMSRTAFGKRIGALGDLGVRKARDGGNNVTYRGLCLRTHDASLPADLLL